MVGVAVVLVTDRFVVTLVVRGCHAFKLVVVLVGVEGVLAMVVVVLVGVVVMILGVLLVLVVVVILVLVIVW